MPSLFFSCCDIPVCIQIFNSICVHIIWNLNIMIITAICASFLLNLSAKSLCSFLPVFCHEHAQYSTKLQFMLIIQVLRIPLRDGRVDPEGVSELFYDHGDLISGSSSAVVYNRKLLIGSVINKLVICDVKAEIL